MESNLYNIFSEIDIRVGKIVKVQEFPEAKNPSYKLDIDFSDELGIMKSSAQITNYKIEDLTGHFENPIKILTLLIKKNCAVKFLAILFSQMSKNDIDVISQNLAEQITNTGLKIKISKQELIMGKIILDGRDAIKIIIIVPVYVKKNAEKIYRQILKI